MGGHSSHSSPFPNSVISSSNPLAPMNSTVVHSQNTVQQLAYYWPQALKGQYHAIFSKTLKIEKTLFG